MIAITSRAIGAISFRSDSIAWSKSYWIAEPPPTSAVTPGGEVVDRVADLGDDVERVLGERVALEDHVERARSCRRSSVRPVGVAEATPSTARRAALAPPRGRPA